MVHIMEDMAVITMDIIEDTTMGITMGIKMDITDLAITDPDTTDTTIIMIIGRITTILDMIPKREERDIMGHEEACQAFLLKRKEKPEG